MRRKPDTEEPPPRGRVETMQERECCDFESVFSFLCRAQQSLSRLSGECHLQLALGQRLRERSCEPVCMQQRQSEKWGRGWGGEGRGGQGERCGKHSSGTSPIILLLFSHLFFSIERTEGLAWRGGAPKSCAHIGDGPWMGLLSFSML